jgi:hypothetical protein
MTGIYAPLRRRHETGSLTSAPRLLRPGESRRCHNVHGRVRTSAIRLAAVVNKPHPAANTSRINHLLGARLKHVPVIGMLIPLRRKNDQACVETIRLHDKAHLGMLAGLMRADDLSDVLSDELISVDCIQRDNTNASAAAINKLDRDGRAELHLWIGASRSTRTPLDGAFVAELSIHPDID